MQSMQLRARPGADIASSVTCQAVRREADGTLDPTCAVCKHLRQEVPGSQVGRDRRALCAAAAGAAGAVTVQHGLPQLGPLPRQGVLQRGRRQVGGRAPRAGGQRGQQVQGSLLQQLPQHRLLQERTSAFCTAACQYGQQVFLSVQGWKSIISESEHARACSSIIRRR